MIGRNFGLAVPLLDIHRMRNTVDGRAVARAYMMLQVVDADHWLWLYVEVIAKQSMHASEIKKKIIISSLGNRVACQLNTCTSIILIVKLNILNEAARLKCHCLSYAIQYERWVRAYISVLIYIYEKKKKIKETQVSYFNRKYILHIE